MQALIPIENTGSLQLTDEDELRIGIAWDALSPNSRRVYKQARRHLEAYLSSTSESLFDLTDVQLASYIFRPMCRWWLRQSQKKQHGYS